MKKARAKKRGAVTGRPLGKTTWQKKNNPKPNAHATADNTDWTARAASLMVIDMENGLSCTVEREQWDAFQKSRRTNKPGPRPDPETKKRVEAVAQALIRAYYDKKPSNFYLHSLPSQFWPDDTTIRAKQYFRTFTAKQRVAIAQEISLCTAGGRFENGKLTY